MMASKASSRCFDRRLSGGITHAIRREDIPRLLRMRLLRSNSCVVRGFERQPQTIADLYRSPRAGKLQVSFE
jgi:hypothetical protein